MSAITASSTHAKAQYCQQTKPIKYKCSHCKERGHKRKFCPMRNKTASRTVTASSIAPTSRKTTPPLRTQGVIGKGRKWRRLNTITSSEAQEATTAIATPTALTIADIEFEKMCKEIGMRVTKQLPIKKSDRRVSFATEPTVIKVAKLHENREEREQLWWPSANRQRASIEKCRETFWKRNSLYRWTIVEDVWKLYAQTILKANTVPTPASTRASTLPPSYDRTLQPDRGLY
jgi:hypothetical protein